MSEIVYHDRYKNALCVEKVYGDSFLRWTYGTLPGKMALHTLVKRAIFSRWYGWRMNQIRSQAKIAPFIKSYDLDASEFTRAADEFDNFNEFFFRKLKPDARPVNPDPSSIVFPADGRHLCVPRISESQGLFVKGEMFDLRTLVDDDQLAEEYADGSLILSRLCPVDYHRFHFPIAGFAKPSRLINGPLLSVNPIALCQNIQILATNKRSIAIVETETIGNVLVMEIGATCVGSITQTYCENSNVEKGAEKGYFSFGGSSTIIIFEPGRINFDQDLVESSAQHRELYARVGDHMGKIV